jgi:hypothetical protein
VTRIAVRGFVAGKLEFEEFMDADAVDLAEVAESHALRLIRFPAHMIEIEFLDDPNPEERFFRFGTEPTGMVRPLRVDLLSN